MQRSFRCGRIEVRPAERQVRVDDAPMAIGSRAFDLLLALIEGRDRVVTKDELLDRVWPGLVVEEHNIQTQVSNLRKLLGAQAIATVPGRGYRLTLPADDEKATAESQAAQAVEPVCLLPAMPVLLGRNDDLRELSQSLREHRIVTVVGAGGIGKTVLALAAAHGARDGHRDGAAWVDLAPVSEPSLLHGAVGDALHVPVAGSKPLAALVRGLQGRQMLLVLDNAEHLLEQVGAMVAALATGAPDLRLLVTSQAALRIEGEHPFRLGGLAVPAVATRAVEAADHGAVALFAAQARAGDRRFVLTDDNVDTVVDLCRRLDGVALAIKLAAARLPLLGLAGLRARLDERFRLLAGGPRDAPSRQQTLRAALDWSYGLLAPAEQAVFRRLGVLVGSFGLELAGKAAADDTLDEWATIDALGALVDRSLVVVEPDETPRYRLLESAREYALLQLGTAGERAASGSRVADVLLAHFSDLVAREPQTLAWYLTEGERPEEAVPHWTRAATLAAARSAYVEAAHHLERAIALLQQVGKAAPDRRAQMQRAELPLLIKLGSLHMLIRGTGAPESQRDFERALALSNEVGTLADRFISTFNLWFVSEAQLRFEHAGRYIEDTRRLAEESGDARFLVQAHHASWTTSIVLGEFGRALEHTQEGYRLYRPVDAPFHRETFVGHDPGICALGCQAVAQFELGDPDGAYDSAERTLAAMRASDHVASRVIGAYCLCGMYVIARDPETMRDVAAEALAACRRLGMTQHIGLFLVYSGWVAAVADGDPQGADDALAGTQMFESTGTHLRVPLLRMIAADACRAIGRRDAAHIAIEKALLEIETHGEFGWKAMAHVVQASLHAADGHLAAAEGGYRQALEVARAQRALSLELRAANGLGALWRSRGERDKARALIDPLLHRFSAKRETRDLAEGRAIVAD